MHAERAARSACDNFFATGAPWLVCRCCWSAPQPWRLADDSLELLHTNFAMCVRISLRYMIAAVSRRPARASVLQSSCGGPSSMYDVDMVVGQRRRSTSESNAPRFLRARVRVAHVRAEEFCTYVQHCTYVQKNFLHVEKYSVQKAARNVLNAGPQSFHFRGWGKGVAKNGSLIRR